MLRINGSNLTIKDVVDVASNKLSVELTEDARERVSQSYNWVRKIITTDKLVYGVNTGFGIFFDKKIKSSDSEILNRNLILSHAVCVGPELRAEIVRAAMLIRANALAIGYSGVRPIVIDTLLEMLNRGVTPVVPSQGSLGSSGDLAPLSHLALVFTKDADDNEKDSGWAYLEGIKLSGKAAMDSAGIERIILGPKEGLAITNGATFSAAIGAIACSEAEKYLNIADIALAMSMEALLCASPAYDERLHQLRPHPGQSLVAQNVRQLIKGSSLIDSGNRIQDAYSIRCAPQVHGAARDAHKFVSSVINNEINSATDNPIIFDENEVISGGNFHGEPIGMTMDFLGIAMAEIGAISERRIFRMIDGRLNSNLPPMLVDNWEAAGMNSGLMMPQYTAASLSLENLTLASPDSIHSLPTSGEQEDHNANSMTAARHTLQIIDNTANILAIELFCASRAIDLRLRDNEKAKLGNGVEKAFKIIRKEIPYQAGDMLWGPDIEKMNNMIKSGRLNEI